MSKRGSWAAWMRICVALLVFAALLSAGCSGSDETTTSTSAGGTATSPAGSQTTYEIRYQTIIPASGVAKTQYFVELVNTMSGGRMHVTAYQADQLVPSSEMLNAVQSRTLDMAETVSGMFSQITTGPLLSGMPYSTFSDAETIALLERYQDGKLMQLEAAEFEANGAHFLGPVYSGPLALLTKKEVKTPDDLKGLKIAALDPTSSSFVVKIGCAAEFIAPEEIYTSIQNGTVDGTLYAGPGVYEEQGMGEVAQYILTPYPVYGAPESMIINLELWNSLPADLQAILGAATQAYAKHLTAQLYLEDQLAFQAGKLKRSPMSDELQAHMSQAATQVWDEMGGVSPQAAEVVTLFRDWQTLNGR